MTLSSDALSSSSSSVSSRNDREAEKKEEMTATLRRPIRFVVHRTQELHVSRARARGAGAHLHRLWAWGREAKSMAAEEARTATERARLAGQCCETFAGRRGAGVVFPAGCR